MNLWTLNHSWLDIKDNLRAFALLAYGAYNAFNTARQGRLSDSGQAMLCIVQHCKQGALGHQPSMTFMDQRWQSQVSYIC